MEFNFCLSSYCQFLTTKVIYIKLYFLQLYNHCLPFYCIFHIFMIVICNLQITYGSLKYEHILAQPACKRLKSLAVRKSLHYELDSSQLLPKLFLDLLKDACQLAAKRPSRQTFDPLGQPKVMAGRDHGFRTFCPSVRTSVPPSPLSKSRKTKQQKNNVC